MKISLEKLAELTKSGINGEKHIQIDSVAPIETATDGQISFISNPKYSNFLNTTKASAVVLSPQLAKKYNGNALVNKDPYLTFAKILTIIHSEGKSIPSIHPSAIVADDASIDENVNIGANAVIESKVVIKSGVSIGAGSYIGEKSFIDKSTIVYPNVTIYAQTQIGKNTIIHSSAVIGADGFGFAPQEDKTWYKIPQIGDVMIGDEVEIGANTTIDRAASGYNLD